MRGDIQHSLSFPPLGSQIVLSPSAILVSPTAELVTDMAIEHLAGRKNLRVVNLAGTRVTEAGRSRLRLLLCKAELPPDPPVPALARPRTRAV